MSDAVTNSEVEDVLSSIRRLVSDNHRSVPRAAHTDQNDLLVLTPALRVDDGDEDALSETASDDSLTTLISRDTLILRDAVVPGDPEAGATPDTETQPEAATPSEQDEPEPAADTATAQTPQPSAASILSAKIAALETAIGNISGEWEPDTPGEDDYSGTQAPSMVWQENVDLDATGRPISGSETSADQDRASASEVAQNAKAQTSPAVQADTPTDDDDDFLDEEALRHLVADIVRSELQGELGERITRNVRKLVRREIHRALAARDLD